MSMKIISFLLAAVLAGKGSAQSQYVQIMGYNDDACQSLNSSVTVAGTIGEDGVEPLGTCINATTSTIQSFTKSTCIGDALVVSTYSTDDCTGESLSTGTAPSSCSERSIISCTTEEPDWPGASNWTVDATFYSDGSCSTANGNTTTLTMQEVLAVADWEEGCFDSGFVDTNAMHRCVGTTITAVFFAAEDTTCSLDAIMAVDFIADCLASPFDGGKYASLECSEITSDTTSDGNGASSLRLSRELSAYFWSVAAATVFVAVAATFN